MGLFDFLKNAGSKIFGKDEPEVSNEELHAQKVENLQNVVTSLELPVEDLTIEVDGDKVTVYGQVPDVATKEKVILAVGNVNGVAVVDDRMSVVEEAPESTFYTVVSGDSLSKISKAHYGDPMKYMIIFEANQPMLSDPDKIYPGQVLRIPPLESDVA